MTSASTIDRVTTVRLACERLQPEHAEELLTLLLDPRVGRALRPGTPLPTEREVRSGLDDKILHWDRHGFGLWLARDRDTGEMVGRGGLQFTFTAGLHEVEAGWAIVPERWGEGLATEIAHAAVEAAFGPLALRHVVALALPGNRASRRVMEKTGFTYERELIHAGLPHVLYRRLPDHP